MIHSLHWRNEVGRADLRAISGAVFAVALAGQRRLVLGV